MIINKLRSKTGFLSSKMIVTKLVSFLDCFHFISLTFVLPT